jgi:two-component system C4-dicarboxylate transport response regulator DctD
LAHKSTLFLDAIDAAPMKVQQKLHRALEVREVTPLGANQSRPFDARIVAASSTQLSERVQEGTFFPTLLFRLNSLTLKSPPLRQRREDIPLLYGLFRDQAAKRYGRKPAALSPDVYRYLRSHDWPGNVRELQSFAEQNVLGLWDGKLAAPRTEPGPTSDTLKARVAEFEKAFIEQTLQEVGGDTQTAIATLGLPRKTFYDKVKRLNIALSDFRSRP